MDTVRFGVLGCAGIARRRMLPAMAADPGITVTALASRRPATADSWAAEYGCAPEYDYPALLDRGDVDAVYVPLPAALHARWTEAALRAGKHVLCEKPLTTDAGRTGELLALARVRGLVLAENVMFVHHPQHETVRRLVADGAIGEPRSLHAAFEVPPLPEDDIRHRPDLGGGALFDVGVYPVRAALHLLGGPLTVVTAELTHSPVHGVDMGGGAVLAGPGGVTAELSFGLDRPYRSQYVLHGSTGRLTVDRAFTPPAGHRPRILLADGSGERVLDLAAHDQVAAALAAFTAAVRTGRGPDPVVLDEAVLLRDIRLTSSRRPM
ncbi:Gfo/Idh/MocA family protein [Streptomyces sp. NPDC051018]|uniref:Gfo/Idh/MocA family protein n=1 Tax=Streptomyces sp. NPDC051018 TaxID=3365639 RepID=UPI0037B7175C